MVDIIGNRKYLEVPGTAVYELPPLLLKEAKTPERMNNLLSRAEAIVENDALLAETLASSPDGNRAREQSKVGLAINLAEHYSQFLEQWVWGESIIEWIRQCEITFSTRPNLRPLLRPDLWPHAGRSSFVTLLNDKKVPAEQVNLENAVGYRLTFRQPPPIDFFSDQFLFFLNSSLAENAYQKWSDSGKPNSDLPPERFQFMVMGTEIREV